MLDLLLFSVGPLSAFNFQAREQPPFERVCWRLTRLRIDHSSFGRSNESSFWSLMIGRRLLSGFHRRHRFSAA
jgi:hypothetical protein